MSAGAATPWLGADVELICPRCGGDLVHREARVGAFICSASACLAWVDQRDEGLVVVDRVVPPLPEEQI